MDERRVKAAILMSLRESLGRSPKPIVAAEFSLGSSGVRADLVAFDHETIGFEIKTARDTLRRLPFQLEAYARYFNHVVAVIAPCHLPSLSSDDLFGASVWTYDERGTLSFVRAGGPNLLDDANLSDLLTRAEMRKHNFRTAMRTRYAATSRHFWKSVSRRAIRPEDLSLLSRFAEDRAQARQLANERLARWSHWLAAQQSVEPA